VSESNQNQSKAMRPTIFISVILFFCFGISTGQEVKPEIHFSINQRNTVSLVRGMPLTLRVRLSYSLDITREELMMEIPDSLQDDSGLAASLDSLYAPMSLCEPSVSWHQKVIIQIASEENSKKHPFELHILSPHPLHSHLIYPDVQQQVVFGIDPEQTLQWKAGMLRVRAGFPFSATSDTLWTAYITLEVQRARLKRIRDANRHQLIELGYYYSAREKCKLAENAADILSMTDSLSFEYMALMGDIAACRGDAVESIAWYQKALRNIPRPSEQHAEEPYILHIKIREQHEKMNR
jgi:hypothetical protein